MVNQQATHDFQLGYIAASIDGEGTIGIHKGDRYGNYKPTIKVFNTDRNYIDYVSSIMKIHDMTHYVYVSNPKRAKLRYRPCYAIVIQGYKRCGNVIDKLIPILVAKRKQAEILKEIIESRLKHPMTRRNQLRQYTKQELVMVGEIRELNRRGKGMRVLND